VVNHEYRIYVGIDWATEAHKACVLIPLILVGRPILPPLRRHHALLDKWWGVLSADPTAPTAPPTCFNSATRSFYRRFAS
jgi:hypothetical protein